MPPPEPRSRTVSPGFNFASAVGLPQPSEAFRASSRNLPGLRVVIQVRGDGVAALVERAEPPQQPFSATGDAARGLAIFLLHCVFYFHVLSSYRVFRNEFEHPTTNLVANLPDGHSSLFWRM